MCGGFIVAYTATTPDAKPRRNSLGLHAWYAIGKLVSYAAIGAVFGLVGRSIAISPGVRVATAVVAGMFLIAYGFTSLGLLPLERYLGARAPVRLLRFFSNMKSRYRHPLTFGLFSGLMINRGVAMSRGEATCCHRPDPPAAVDPR
jgi:sulfite exporter TauE/SafE